MFYSLSHSKSPASSGACHSETLPSLNGQRGQEKGLERAYGQAMEGEVLTVSGDVLRALHGWSEPIERADEMIAVKHSLIR